MFPGQIRHMSYHGKLTRTEFLLLTSSEMVLTLSPFLVTVQIRDLVVRSQPSCSTTYLKTEYRLTWTRTQQK